MDIIACIFFLVLFDRVIRGVKCTDSENAYNYALVIYYVLISYGRFSK